MPTREELVRPDFGEGLRVVYLGLFVPLPLPNTGNEPIVRFGHVAMVPRGRIIWDTGESIEAILVEVNAFGGNSGGPVFVFLQGQSSPKLLGVLKGVFSQQQPAKIVGAPVNLTVTNVVGIAAVVPSILLTDLLERESD